MSSALFKCGNVNKKYGNLILFYYKIIKITSFILKFETEFTLLLRYILSDLSN